MRLSLLQQLCFLIYILICLHNREYDEHRHKIRGKHGLWEGPEEIGLHKILSVFGDDIRQFGKRALALSDSKP
jgi:hypothetical protein